MKKIIILALATFSTIAFAQQKPAAKPAAKPEVAATGATSKEELLCKAWKLVSTEQFSTINKPTEKQKNDGVTYVADGTAFLTIEGVAKTGKWSFDKPKANVTIEVDGGAEKYKFKIINLTKDQFYYEYQDPDLIRTKYTCEPVKK